MFFFRKMIGLFFFGLLIFGLLGFFGRGSGSRYESAYRQGFMDGQQAAVGSGEEAPKGVEDAASAAPGTQIYYRGNEFFFPSSGLLLCLVPLFAFGFLFMGMSKRHHRHGRRGGWGHHGPCGPGRGSWGPPPWKQGEDNSTEKSPDDIDDEPDEGLKYA